MSDLLQENEIIDDRYKISESLGEGGRAVVFKAHDLINDNDVAIKRRKSDTAANKTNLARFEREARAAASLNCRNIVKVLNVGTYNGNPYRVNEFVDGQNLRQILNTRGKFSFREACDIRYQLCSAVKYAHDHSVIHRDIKPQNIYLTIDGTVKLGDFGIATFRDTPQVSAITSATTILGSVQYRAPEVCQRNPATTRSDIYAMGITFFELITGHVPFNGDTPQIIRARQSHQKFPSLKKYNPNTPDCIEEIIVKACAKDSMERYGSADERRKDIEAIRRDPSKLAKKMSFFYAFFHPSSPLVKARKEEQRQKKQMRKDAKKAQKEQKR